MSVPARVLACCLAGLVAWLPARARADAPQAPDGLLPGNEPLQLVHRQSLYAGYLEDRVGTAVALAGELLAVGVPGADSGSTWDTGRVDLYRWFDGQWVRMDSYYPWTFGIPVAANSRFGAAVSLSADWLLIGCPGCPPEAESKAILLHVPDTIERPASVRGALEWYRATPPELAGFGDPSEGTGASVALSVVRSGSIVSPGQSIVLAVGSPAATFDVLERGLESVALGAVSVGRLDLGLGEVVWESEPWHGAVALGKFGRSLSMSAATWINLGLYANQRDLVVGEPAWVPQGGSGVPGRAVLYRREGSHWTSLQSLEAATPGFFDALGSAVAVERVDATTPGVIALGAPGRNHGGTPAGAVLMFRQSSPGGDYVFTQEIQHPAAATADRFGGALALSEGRLLAGADGRAVGTSANAGAAYVYRYEFDLLVGAFRWRYKQSLTEPDDGGNAAFGYSVALGPRVAAIGAPQSDAAGLANAGRVATYLCDRIFRYGLDTPAQACAGP